MRKYAIGFIVGILVATAGVAAADSLSLIGKKIQSEAAVTLDGKQIDTAIIVDGKSYAPVRSVAEATGLKVGYEKGNVNLKTINDNSEALKSAGIRLESLEIDLQTAIRLLSNTESKIQSSLEGREKWQSRLDSLPPDASGDTRQYYEGLIADNVEGHVKLEAELAERQARVTEIEAQIAEAQAEIAKLK